MKISTMIGIFVIIGMLLATFALMTQEAKTYHPSANISDSDWAGKYDYVDDVNRTVAPLKATFEQIEDENTGWFTKITAGIVAIPRAVIAFVSVALSSIIMGGALVTGTLSTFGLPAYFIFGICVVMFIWLMAKLIEIYQRWQV
jgi:hypothetical protein